MIWLVKICVAWLLAIGGMTVIGGLPRGRSASQPSWDGFFGIALVMGLPMLLFALVIALPLSLLITRSMSPFAGAILYPVLISGAAWLTGASLPSGWKGVQQAMSLFAFIMGVSWSLLSLLVWPSSASI
ncbi:hypothetical protein G4G27_13855 [Sphingomonas sp. So64.6b]|uniref:hypothetical protein n=1 Tax=Sphingomonas sp. So64.6b TaxID=2997354 RepID=UPI001602729D|nr:hypothetical protein [Sphingomonas sp. So64.6b]QNA84959.1 hypothetical protein G4G27_13855 [Sphingomonas sp. So64.6b]